MAGMQSCFRSITITTNLRLIQKNGVLRQASRGRHSLAFQMFSRERPNHINKTKFLVNSFYIKNIRLASTNIPKQGDETVQSIVSQSTDKSQTFADNASPSTITIDESSLPPIPTLEDPSQIGSALEFVSTGLKEPSFESLGLASYWPSGIFQRVLEFLHINLDLPWWGAIVIITIAFRVLLLPLNIKARKNAINTHNHLPQMQRLQIKLTEARNSGNYYDSAYHLQEMLNFTEKHNISPFKAMLPQLVQSPVFLSMYFALKGMADAPVESLKTGGLFWFTDLTIPDPYYALPCIVVGSVYLILETGAEGGSLSTVGSHWLKLAVRGGCLIFLPFMISVPQGILWYWTVSNSITMIQLGLFKLKPVKRFLNMPEYIKHDPNDLPLKKKSMSQGFKESLTNYKLTRELQERDHLNSVTFERAGKEPVQRTFKKNPKLRNLNSSK